MPPELLEALGGQLGQGAPPPLPGLSDTGISDLEVLNGSLPQPGPDPRQAALNAIGELLRVSDQLPEISRHVANLAPKIVKAISPQVGFRPESTDLLPPVFEGEGELPIF